MYSADRIPSDQDSSGRSFGEPETANLRNAIKSGILFGPKGSYVKELEQEFAAWNESDHGIAASSGTAAIHTALAAIDIDPGDEVVTTGITDIGAVVPILYQGGIPVFCDVDPKSGNLDADSVRGRITDRTRAIIVTHLFGNPADVVEIRAIATARGIPIIEDCAQAFGATIGGRKVGGFGDIATFSLQQGKHITSGEGGLMTTDNADLARHMRLYVNKAWDYDDPSDHDFLALNYRMTELQAAVAVAQLAQLDDNIATRRRNAESLLDQLAGVPGVDPVTRVEGADPSYWRVGLLVDPTVVPGGTDALAAKLSGVNVPAASRYIKKPAFQTGLIQNQKTFGGSRWPFTLATDDALDFSPERFTGTFQFLSRVLVIPWNERLTSEHVGRIADAITTAVDEMIEEAA